MALPRTRFLVGGPGLRALGLAGSILFALAAGGGCGHAPSRVAVRRPAGPARPLEIYFVRHGETVSNATGRYDAYGIDRLSALGEREVAAVAAALRGVRFDAAVVSPSPRALRTVGPILKGRGLVAEVWPELNECCTQKGAARRLPPSKTLPRGGELRLAPEFAGFAKLRPGDDRRFAPADYQDGLAQTRLAADRLRRAFGGRGMRVLVVGHSLEGSRLLDMLLGRKPIGDIELKNCSVHVLRQRPDGRFELVSAG